MGMEVMISLKAILAAFIFSVIGLIFYVFGFWAFDKLTPGDLWKEIIEEHNNALAIVCGAVAIGISMIIAAAIQG